MRSTFSEVDTFKKATGKAFIITLPHHPFYLGGLHRSILQRHRPTLTKIFT